MIIFRPTPGLTPSMRRTGFRIASYTADERVLQLPDDFQEICVPWAYCIIRMQNNAKFHRRRTT